MEKPVRLVSMVTSASDVSVCVRHPVYRTVNTGGRGGGARKGTRNRGAASYSGDPRFKSRAL